MILNIICKMVSYICEEAAKFISSIEFVFVLLNFCDECWNYLARSCSREIIIQRFQRYCCKRLYILQNIFVFLNEHYFVINIV